MVGGQSIAAEACRRGKSWFGSLTSIGCSFPIYQQVQVSGAVSSLNGCRGNRGYLGCFVVGRSDKPCLLHE